MKKTKSWALGLLLILSAFLTQSCNERINAGYEGLLVKDYGSDKGVQDVTMATGRVWYNPFTETVVENPLFVQTVDYAPFTVDAKGGGTFTIDPTISIKPIKGRTPEVYVKYRLPIHEVVETTGLNIVKNAYRIEFNKHDVDWLVNNRETLETNVETFLRSEFSNEGFDLQTLTHGMSYPQSISDAIDAKNKATQQALQVEINLKKALAQAKIDLVNAETKAKTNELENRTITDNLIKMKFIEKWDGKTPLYGQSPMLMKNIQ